MARARDESKRCIIMLAAKRLFAKQGFHNTSISDIKKETGLPVGSIYTYFDSKDDIMASIIDEGWAELYERVNSGFDMATTIDARVKVITDVFFIDLVKDTDLIIILLTEALELTKIAEKLDYIVKLVLRLRPENDIQSQQSFATTDSTLLRTSVVVNFLGFLNAARLSKSGQLGVRIDDVQAFMHHLIYSSLAQLGTKGTK